MNRVSCTFLLVMLLFYRATIHAQSLKTSENEYANYPCELIDGKRVFVDAPLNQRDGIVKALRQRSDLIIVERPEEADFILKFAYALPADELTSSFKGDNAQTASAEITVWKEVSDPKGGTRSRILLHWSGENSFHNVSIPWSVISPSGFNLPSSPKKLKGELIGRVAVGVIGAIWPDRFQVDQLANQVTIKAGGKLEQKGIKWFLQQLSMARRGFYAGQCPGQSLAPFTPGLLKPRSDPFSQAPELQFDPSAFASPLEPGPRLLPPPSESIPVAPGRVFAPSTQPPLSPPSLPQPWDLPSGLGPARLPARMPPSSGRQPLLPPPDSKQFKPGLRPVRLNQPTRSSGGIDIKELRDRLRR